MATSLTFVPALTVTLKPGESRAVNVVAGPPSHYTVRFALVPDRADAEPNDASLDRSEVVTDDNGIASVVITAPSKPTTFTLRASIDDSLEASVPVSVSDKGFGSVIVEPRYAGSRVVDSWVASVRVGSACSDLTGFPPPDGALSASTAAEDSPKISSIPVGLVAAVGVRAGKFAYGCTNVENLETDEERVIRVDVADRPMNLDSSTLAMTLEVDTNTQEWSTLLETAIGSALDGFRGETANDVELLLGAMSAQITSTTARADFDATRLDADFDALTAERLAPSALRDAASRWLAAGASDVSKNGALEGELELDGSSALFTLTAAGGVPTTSSGFLGSSTWTAFSDPGDTLVLGGKLMFQAERWVVALAEAPAIAEHASAPSAPEALAEIAECDALGADLTAAAGEIYAGCGAACAEKLCQKALVSLWTRAQDGWSELTTLSVGVTGGAEVDDEARPRALAGTWVGTLGDGATSMVGGRALGIAPSED